MMNNNGYSSVAPPSCNVCRCTCPCRQGLFPPGYKFTPNDKEVVVDYLKKKVMNNPLPYNHFMTRKIPVVNLYSYNPEVLAGGYALGPGERDWYFFTSRNRKYPNGERPNRAAGNGYWKATGKDKEIKNNGVVVGYRKALVFYVGKAPKGDKTNWIMHEFRFNALARKRTSSDDMKLDDWVLCRIYERNESNKSQLEEQEETENQLPTAALEEIEIQQGGNNNEDQQLNTTNGYVETFTNTNNVELLQPPFNPYNKFQKLPPLRIGSPIRIKDVPSSCPQYYEDDQQDYVPLQESNQWYFQTPQQQQQIVQPQILVPPQAAYRDDYQTLLPPLRNGAFGADIPLMEGVQFSQYRKDQELYLSLNENNPMFQQQQQTLPQMMVDPVWNTVPSMYDHPSMKHDPFYRADYLAHEHPVDSYNPTDGLVFSQRPQDQWGQQIQHEREQQQLLQSHKEFLPVESLEDIVVRSSLFKMKEMDNISGQHNSPDIPHDPT